MTPQIHKDEVVELINKAQFNIRWDKNIGCYKVNIPQYDGGAVVPLADAISAINKMSEHIAGLTAELAEANAKIKKLSTPTYYVNLRDEGGDTPAECLDGCFFYDEEKTQTVQLCAFAELPPQWFVATDREDEPPEVFGPFQTEQEADAFKDSMRKLKTDGDNQS